MAREAQLNKVANALLEGLKDINGAQKPDLWFTSPKTFQRGFIASGLSADRPALLVQVGGYEEVSLMMHEHEATVTFGIHMIVDGGKTSEQALVRLCEDVTRAVAANESLQGLVTWIFAKSYLPQAEVMEKVGLGVATLICEARYVWQHDAA